MPSRNPAAACGAAALGVALLVGGCSSHSASTAPSSSPPASSAARTPADNGEAAKSPDQVVNDSLDALKKAGAAHVQGTVRQKGQPLQVDLDLVGNDTAGTVTENGTTVNLVIVNNDVYAKAPKKFWTDQANLPGIFAGQLDGRWVKVPPSQASAITKLTLDSLIEQFRSAEVQTSGAGSGGSASGTASSSGAGSVRRGTFDGQPVVQVSEPDGTQLDVAATGPPYPLQIQRPGDDGGTLTLSKFGQRQAITAPSGALDLSAFGGLLSGSAAH